MYCAHFKLKQRPFDDSSDPPKLFLEGSRATFSKALMYVISRERGFVKITGAVGSGKTTLCRWLLRTLPKEEYRVLHLADPTLSALQLDFALAEALGIEAPRDRAEQLGVQIEASLRGLVEGPVQVIVLIDEAHAMPLETLERLRLLGQGAGDGDNALRLIFLGPQDLDRRLAEREFAALRDRIVHSLRLRRLNHHDVRDYLNTRLRSADYEGRRIFSSNAVRLIAGLSRGLPRRINLLADKAMMAAALERQHEVRSRHVSAAAREIKLERKRAMRPPNGVLALAAGLGFSAGAVVAIAAVMTALRMGWVPLREPTSSVSAAATGGALSTAPRDASSSAGDARAPTGTARTDTPASLLGGAPFGQNGMVLNRIDGRK